MTDEQFQKYNAERNAIIKEYNAKMLKTAGIVGGIGVAVVAVILVVCVGILQNAPVGIVLSLIAGLFAVILGWMRVLMVKNAKEKKLQEFEDQSLLQRNY